MIAQWDSSPSVLPVARVQFPTTVKYSKGFFPGWSYSANPSWASVAENGSISPQLHHTTCGQRGGRPKSNHGQTMADSIRGVQVPCRYSDQYRGYAGTLQVLWPVSGVCRYPAGTLTSVRGMHVPCRYSDQHQVCMCRIWPILSLLAQRFPRRVIKRLSVCNRGLYREDNSMRGPLTNVTIRNRRGCCRRQSLYPNWGLNQGPVRCSFTR